MRRPSRFLSSQAGYSMSMWACFLGLCLLPLFVLTVEVSRFANIVADIEQAADAAALAAVQEIDPNWWREQGDARYSYGASLVYEKAQEYIDRNADTATVRLSVTGASVTPRDQDVDLVRVEVTGNLKQIWKLGDRQVSKVGIAALRLRHY